MENSEMERRSNQMGFRSEPDNVQFSLQLRNIIQNWQKKCFRRNRQLNVNLNSNKFLKAWKLLVISSG
jgi:hypothetical protein